MSLRYRLDKDRFKGKKLPPKVRTNEDHVSPDQRGDHSSMDDPYSAGGMKQELKRRLEHEADQMSRRGLFSGLNKMRDYAQEQDEKEKASREGTGRKVRRKKKKRVEESATAETETAVQEAEAAVEQAEAPATALEDTVVEETETVPNPEPGTEKPKRGIFRRVKDHFFPSIYDDTAAPPKAAKPAKAGTTAKGEMETIELISPTDAVEEARRLQTDVPEDEYTEEEKQLDRRNLIRQSVHFLAKPAVDKVQKKIDKVNNAMDQVTKRPPVLRPPGAISERQFLQACTRCDKCIQACPKDAIKKVPKKLGWIIMDTPYIDPMKVPCVMCDDLPCISACQDEALLPVAAPADVNMGYVLLDKKHCVAYGDGFCQQCLIDCPIPGAITQKENRPVFHRNVCTGCGACVRACATVNIPVALKVKPQMVIEAQQRRKEREQEEAELAAKMEEERKRLEAEQAALKAEEAALAREKGWTDEDGA